MRVRVVSAALVFLAVLAVLVAAGCAAPDRLDVGDSTRFTLRELAEDDRYGVLGVAPLRVERGDPDELAGVAPGGGTPYFVTIGFASGRPSAVTGLDDTGAEHQPLDAATAGRLRPCVVETDGYTQCRIFVVPPGTELVGLVIQDVAWPVG